MPPILSLFVVLVLAGPALAAPYPELPVGIAAPSQVAEQASEASDPEGADQADAETPPASQEASPTRTVSADADSEEDRDAMSPLARAVARVDSLSAALGAAADADEVQPSLNALREALAEAAEAEEGMAEDLQQAERNAASQGTPAGLGWEVLGGGFLLVLLGAGAGWVAASRRGSKGKPMETHDKGYLQSTPHDQNHPDRDADSAGTHHVEAALQALEQTLVSRIDRLEQSFGSRASPTQGATSTPRAPAPTPTHTSRTSPSSPPRGDQGHARAIGATFVAWCRGAGPRVSEREAFADQLATDVPGTTVRAVFRDRDSARLPVVFTDDGGRSPAEYWLVEGVGGSWLLPFPQGARQFRDLADGTFTGGRIAPQSLREAVPATLQSAEGGGFSVAKPGHLA